MNLIFPIHDIKVFPKRVKDLKINSIEMLYDKISTFQIRGQISYNTKENIGGPELADVSFTVPNGIKVVNPINKEIKIDKYIKIIISYKRNLLTRSTTITIKFYPISNTYDIPKIESTFKTEFYMHTIIE